MSKRYKSIAHLRTSSLCQLMLETYHREMADLVDKNIKQPFSFGPKKVDARLSTVVFKSQAYRRFILTNNITREDLHKQCMDDMERQLVDQMLDFYELSDQDDFSQRWGWAKFQRMLASYQAYMER